MNDQRRLTSVSKGLSRLLRHDTKGLHITADGFIRVNDILQLRQFKGIKEQDVIQIVSNCSKQRFTLRTDEMNVRWIKANQGHTMAVPELELELVTDAMNLPIVVHGTSMKNWESIREQGLSVMSRNHMHFAVGLFGEVDVTSGMRANCNVFLYVDVPTAMSAGVQFFRSPNNVILTKGLNGVMPLHLFSRVITKRPNSQMIVLYEGATSQ